MYWSNNICFNQKEPLVLNLKYDQGRTTRLTLPERPTGNIGRYERSVDVVPVVLTESEKRVNQHLLNQKIKISDYLHHARNLQIEHFQAAMCEVVQNSHNLSKMPIIRISH